MINTNSELCLSLPIHDQEHLRSRGHIATMRALEHESGVEADVLGDDAAFLRSLVLDGRWEDAVTLLEVCVRVCVCVFVCTSNCC